MKIFERLRKLFDTKAKRKEREPLPDDVVVEILSRLPTEDALTCRMVCKRWRSLTSTTLFLGVHATRAPSIILLQHQYCSKNPGHKNDLYLLACSGRPRIKRLDTSKLQLRQNLQGGSYQLVGTCNGLVVLTLQVCWNFHILICDPLTGREVTLATVEQRTPSTIYGFWFDPAKKEYMFLAASMGETNVYRYRTSNLRGKSTVLYFSHRYDAAIPDYRCPPINIDGSLHILLYRSSDPIMIFNIESEKISFKHCPTGHPRVGGPRCLFDECLLQMEGSSLAFSRLYYDTGSLELFVLKNHANWRWIRAHVIDLAQVSTQLSAPLFKLSAIQDGEMLIVSQDGRFMSYNMDTKRVRKIMDFRIPGFSSSHDVVSTAYVQLLT